MKNSKVNGSPISQNGRFVNPFSEKFFEGFIAQKLSDVKSFLKYFSESQEAQTEENVKTFFKIFSSVLCVVNRCDPKRIISRRDMVRYRN